MFKILLNSLAQVLQLYTLAPLGEGVMHLVGMSVKSRLGFPELILQCLTMLKCPVLIFSFTCFLCHLYLTCHFILICNTYIQTISGTECVEGQLSSSFHTRSATALCSLFQVSFPHLFVFLSSVSF
jgi:hypothetical protein